LLQTPAKSALISGIGVAGPTLAYWLAERGFEPVLVERSPTPRTGGYVIDFWGLGYDVAERMGLLPSIRGDGYQIEELRLVDGRGRRVGGFDADVFRKLTGGRYVSLRRGNLAALLYRKIQDRCETIFGDGITAVEQGTDGVWVTFDRASTRRFDLLIGADGLHSTVRGLVFGPQHRFERYLGYAVAAFEAKGYRPRDDNVYVSHAVPGKQVARFALRDDRTMFLFVFSAVEDHLHELQGEKAQRAIVRQEFEEVGWECPRILAALDECQDLYFDRVSQIRMNRWWRGRVALVGDAAFCPSLLAGQGSALAMTAAYVLAGELARADGQIEPALARYQAVLGSFIARKQKAAERFAGSFAPKSWLGLYVRNQVTRMLGIPAVATLVLGGTLLDRLGLPPYPTL
jgi:2-polyprenyl-6-methoxyphenol hydroxylase-like FAD-dependent oxidoreductase